MESSIIKRSWLDSLLHFFYPEVCQICLQQRAKAADGFVCSNCWRGVRFIKPPLCERCGLPFEGNITSSFECANCREMDLHFRYARSAVVAKGIVLDVIHRYKYHRAYWFEPFLADLLIRQAQAEIHSKDWDVIVPVPLHSMKQREREFNQAARIAQMLGQALNIRTNASILERTLPTRTQTQLTRDERATNVRNAFCIANDATVRDRRIVLVDDVFTTGATTSACARVLRKAGAADVCVWTVARGL